MPKKFISCVKKVSKKYPNGKYNPYAVCRKSTKYFGSSHNIGLKKPIKKLKLNARR